MTRIAVDLDGVFIDWHQTLADTYRVWFDDELGPFTEWDDPLLLSCFDTWPELLEWATRAGTFDDAEYIPGAPAAVDYLAEAHQPIFVTARHGDAAVRTATWHRSSPWFNRVGLRTAQTNKLNTPCAIYVDDSPDVIRQVTAAGKVGIVFDQPWNEKFECDDVLSYRAKGWREVLEIVESMS